MPYKISNSIGQFSCYHGPCLISDDFFCPNELVIRPGSYAGHQKSKGRDGRAFIHSRTSSLVILARISWNTRFTLRYCMVLWCIVGYCGGAHFQASILNRNVWIQYFVLGPATLLENNSTLSIPLFGSTAKACFVLNSLSLSISIGLGSLPSHRDALYSRL